MIDFTALEIGDTEVDTLLADLKNAQRVLGGWGVDPKTIKTGWHESQMCIIIDYPAENDKDLRQMNDTIQVLLESMTTINIPIVVKKPPFKFNFKSSKVEW